MKWTLGVSVVVVIGMMAATMSIPAATITPDEATLRLFPKETQALAFLDVAGMRATPLFQEWMASGAAIPKGISEFVSETGFAIDKDVDTVTVGRLGPRDFLAIVRARYNKPRVEYFLNSKQVPFETVMGRVIHHPDRKAAISFIDDMILVGSNSGVRDGIERMGSAPPSDLRQNAKLMDGIRVIEVGNQVWAIGEFSQDMIPRGMKGPAQAAALLQTFEGGVYQMRLDQDVHVKATGNFENAESAQTASDLMRGLLALAKLQIHQQEGLLHVLDGVSVDSSGSVITVGFDASGDLLKKLKDYYRPTIEPAQ